MKAIEKFNGEFTFINTMTGERRTFRIRTQPKDAKFAPGARLVSLLTGPCNEKNYTGFAFLNEGHTPMIHLYRKKNDPTHRYYARLLEALEYGEGEVTIGNHTYEVLQSTLCRMCNRKLTTPESIKSGIGPVCAGRV